MDCFIQVEELGLEGVDVDQRDPALTPTPCHSDPAKAFSERFSACQCILGPVGTTNREEARVNKSQANGYMVGNNDYARKVKGWMRWSEHLMKRLKGA
jgi:hypothetical protein